MAISTNPRRWMRSRSSGAWISLRTSSRRRSPQIRENFTESILPRRSRKQATDVTAATLDGFEGPSFVSTDLRATKHFWADYLGGSVLAEASDDGRRPCEILFGGVVLEFYPAQAGEAPGAGG